MRLDILHVPGCPNVAVLRQRLDQVVAQHNGPVDIIERAVTDLASAQEYGMTGSPTLLVDGVDPFARPELVPSESCRLYRDGDGRVDRAPSVTALREALSSLADRGVRGPRG